MTDLRPKMYNKGMVTKTELILNILNTVTSKASYLNADILTIKKLTQMRSSIYKTDYVYDTLLKEILLIDKSLSIYK